MVPIVMGVAIGAGLFAGGLIGLREHNRREVIERRLFAVH